MLHNSAQSKIKEIIESVPGYNVQHTVALYQSPVDSRPINKDLQARKGNIFKKKKTIVNEVNYSVSLISASEFSEFRNELDQMGLDIASNAEKRKKENKENANENIIYEKKLSDFASLRNFVLNNPSYADMPATIFVSMNVFMLQSTALLATTEMLATNRGLLTTPVPLNIIAGSGIDFQSQKIIDYFVTREGTSLRLNEDKLNVVFDGMMKNEMAFFDNQKTDIVVGMPRGLVSFLAGFVMIMQSKNLPKADIDMAANRIKELYWDHFLKNAALHPNIQFCINSLGSLTDTQIRNMPANVIIHKCDITLLTKELQEKMPEKKIILQMAGDSKALVKNDFIGMHYNSHDPKATSAHLYKFGQEEILGATTRLIDLPPFDIKYVTEIKPEVTLSRTLAAEPPRQRSRLERLPIPSVRGASPATTRGTLFSHVDAVTVTQTNSDQTLSSKESPDNSITTRERSNAITRNGR